MFIDYVKAIYRESVVERDTEVVKWPPTPSTVYINLACINRQSVSGKSREYAEVTKARFMFMFRGMLMSNMKLKAPLK